MERGEGRGTRSALPTSGFSVELLSQVISLYGYFTLLLPASFFAGEEPMFLWFTCALPPDTGGPHG